jgi:hypothetical protein
VSTLTCALTARQLARRARVDGGVRRPDGPASGTVVGTAAGDRRAGGGEWAPGGGRWRRRRRGRGWWRGLVLTHLGLGEWNRWDDDDDHVFVFPQSNWAETGRSVWASLFRKWYGPAPGPLEDSEWAERARHGAPNPDGAAAGNAYARVQYRYRHPREKTRLLT